jgi:hypothetical protein
MQEDQTARSLPAILPGAQGADVARAVVLGTIGMVPIVGSLLSELASTFYPETKLNRLLAFAEALRASVDEIQDRLDNEFVRRDEFAQLFEDVLDRATQVRNAEKLAIFASATAHAMTVDRPGQAERDRFLDLLDQLRPAQLRVLAAIARGNNERGDDLSVLTRNFDELVITAASVRYMPDAFESLQDLQRLGLARDMANGEVFQAAVQDIRTLLTGSGHRFVEFLTIPALDRAGAPASISGG